MVVRHCHSRLMVPRPLFGSGVNVVKVWWDVLKVSKVS